MSLNPNFIATSKDASKQNDCRWETLEYIQPHRSVFSRDRDRILYSKSFLRLRGKTQVFMLNRNDYIRTRLTHTLEVNQIAKTIARSLQQNIELVEAIALGHDVGHTPFGHVGERTLNELLNTEGTPEGGKGFKHNLQALRLLCDLEKGADFPTRRGLNLTKYTLWGIAHHSKVSIEIHPFYSSYINRIQSYWSIEGLIVAIADEIAQRHHDVEDSLQYSLLSRKEIVERFKCIIQNFTVENKRTYKSLLENIETLDDVAFMARLSRLIVNLYVVDTINQSRSNILNFENAHNINSQNDFALHKANIAKEEYEILISFSNKLKEFDVNFQEFLKEKILYSFDAQAMDGKGEYIIRRLFRAFRDNPKQLPDTSLSSMAFFFNINPYNRRNTEEYIESLIKNHNDIKEKDGDMDDETKIKEDHYFIFLRCITDYIGGMTDNFAYAEYDRLYGTRVF